MTSSPGTRAWRGAPAGGGNGGTVLLVDDERMLRRELAELLAEEGVAVVGEADSGIDGVALAALLAPDVVLMDLRMPGMGGLEATRRVRASLPGTRVIILSAYDDAGLQQSAREAGAIGYLVKGCAVDDILAALHAAAGAGDGQ
ncbi:MAG: response regulator transcription factor [Actinomycetota bacterium]